MTLEAVVAKDPSLDEMRDEAYRRQDNLAADIDELIDRVNPKNAVQRWKNEIVGSVKSFSEAGDGKTPSNGALAVAGGVIGLVVLTTGIAIAVALSGDDEKKAHKEAEKAREQAAKDAEKAREDARKARAAFFADVQTKARNAEKQVRGGIEQARKDATKSRKKARKNAAKARRSTSSDIEKALKRARKAVARATR